MYVRGGGNVYPFEREIEISNPIRTHSMGCGRVAQKQVFNFSFSPSQFSSSCIDVLFKLAISTL